MRYRLELEITGLGVLVQRTGREGKNAQLLWMEGDWKGIPGHRPLLAVDLAMAERPEVDGIENQVVRLADGRTFLLLDLTKTEVVVDTDVEGTGVRLNMGRDPLPDPDPVDDPEQWRDLRFIAGMDIATSGKVHGRYIEEGAHRGQVQGRMNFDKGTFSAAIPHDRRYRKRWVFSDDKKLHRQFLTDRLVWTYESDQELKPIQLRVRRKRREAIINLRPRKKPTNVSEATLTVSATCYPALGGERDARLAAYLDKPLEWGDFPVFYEVLSPEVPEPTRMQPRSEDIFGSITDVWCPTVRADAR